WLPIYSGGGELLKAIDVDKGGAIPPEGTEGTATFTFTVDGDLGTVENIDVRFSAAHTYTGDLDVSLKSPQGKAVKLFASVGRSGDNFQDTVLDDDGSRIIGLGSAPFDGTYRPQESLADFNGENPQGTWTLKVTDTYPSADNGILYRAGEQAPWGTAIGTQLLLRNPLVQSGGGNGGAINLEATHSDISVGNIRSFSKTADGGRIDLKANNNIITGLINSSSVQRNGGAIKLVASGNIITQDLYSYSDSYAGNLADGGAIELVAGGNITTQDLYSYSYSIEGNSRNGGHIFVEANGDITIQGINSSSHSIEGNSGNGGAVSIDGDSNVTATQDLYSYSHSSKGNSGNGGFVSIDAGSNVTATQGINSSSHSIEGNSGNGGFVSVQARINITTQKINSYSLSKKKSGNGGTIDLVAGGNITTQYLNASSRSEKGDSGNGGAIDLDAGDSITTQDLNASSGSEYGDSGDGGDISAKADSDINTQDINSYSDSEYGDSADGGAINLVAGNDIKTQDINAYSRSEKGDSGNGGVVYVQADGNVTIQGLISYSDSSKGSSGDGGTIDLVAGGDITTQDINSFSFSYRGDSGNGGAIDLVAGGDITTQDINSFSFSNGGNSGNGGAVNLHAKQINPPEGGNTEKLKINTFSVGKKESGEGKGGDVSITTNNVSNTEILTVSSGSGSGKITIESQAQEPLQINDSSIITSAQVTLGIRGSETRIDVREKGKSGNVSINSSGDLNLKNVTIESDTKSDQAAGDVNIYSGDNITLNNTDIISTTNSQGNAGQITLETNQNIELTNNSKILASTEGDGNAGQINIEANNLILDQNTKLITETARAGNPGNINIQANTIDIGEGAKASTTVLTGSTSTGEGGNITINTNELNVTGKLGIFAETEASKNAGILRISPYKNNPDLDITFKNEGFISASTSSTGNGGNIFIKAPENINITGQGFIATKTSGTGNAGIIDIKTNNLRISNGVKINASTEDQGNAGEIKINTTDFTLEKGTSLTTETSSAGLAGNIEINTKNLTIGQNAQISATALEGASNKEAGGNITINANNLDISGKLGIFAETAGESPAGTLTLNPYKNNPNLNIEFQEKGFISARTKSLGKGGDINILAPENINITGDGQITVETKGSGDAGIINIETENLKIAENTKISASTSDSGNGGEIKINSSETFQLQGKILTETTGTGDGGIINIEAGEITAPNSKISAKTTDAGNAGTIDITAQGDITTGVVTSAAKNDIETADGGSISITSEQGKINATRAIQSFSEGGSAGDVTLKAQTDITAKTISSHGKQEGGQITITSETGNIDTSSGNFLANYSGGGDAGDITMEAPQGNITTNDIYSYADGDGGQISIKAGNNINIKVNSNIISASEPPNEGNSDKQGQGGDITLEAGNNINTTTAKIYSGANEGDTGKIDITADNAIETGKIDLASGFVRQQEKVNENFTIIPKPEGEATQGKAREIRLRSRNSTIDTTGGTINSRSPDGTGDIIINAKGNISTGKLEASALNPDNPTTGGDVNITSEQGEINATQNIETFSEKGTAGDVNITAVGQIQTNNILSQGMERGGNIQVKSKRGEIQSRGNIDSYSEQGRGGNVKVDAPERVNLANVSSYGMTESGDLIIQSQQAEVNTVNVTTQAPEGYSGRIVINGTEVGTGNLSSIARTSAGEINVEATDGSIATYDIEMTSDGTIGALTLRARENITTEDVTQNAGEGNVDINIESGRDQNIGNTTQIAKTGDTNNVQTAGRDQNSGNVNQNSGGNANNIQTAGRDQNIGQVTQTAGGNTKNIQTAGRDQNIGQVTQTAGGNTKNIQTAGRDQNIGQVTQNAENNTINIQTASGEQNIEQINQTFGNESINIQDQEINQSLDTTSAISNNNVPNNQVLNQEDFSNNNNNNIEDNFTTNPSNNKNILSNLTQSQRSELISNSTPSNNNQTTNTNTAQEQTESSINSTTDTKKILNTINAINTNYLTVSANLEEAVTVLEQSRTNEYSNYFGTDFKEQFINQKTPREILTDMAAKIGKESAVVYINAYPEELQIILYTKDGQPILKTIPEANRKKLEKVVINFLKLTTSPAYRDFNSYLSPAKQLYDWFIAPISAELEAANIDTLLFSMGEGLRILPVAALHDGKQFLIEKYSLSLIPSISLMDTNYRPLQGTQVLAMGASKFINEKPLPAVPVEIETISEQLWEGSKFLNEEFTKNNLLTQRKNYPYPIIHLATHATFNRGKPSNSYIQLWGNEQIKLDQVRELGWSTPSVDLLVLSACRTAVGNREAELGFAGLAVAAGVKSALTSLWTVSDEGTLALMTEFYTHLNDAKIKSEALRQAQLAMLQGQVLITGGELRGSSTRGGVELPSAFANVNNQNLSHPYYWAGFTMVGSPW
ncbi:MAG: CHAT domain-containing protein, partial [Trichodesmium erythraeum GBRTRLIN201]|nr:CHAT domain-containing protein [Trichodesmium erythraeum GBRTRLIN201]